MGELHQEGFSCGTVLREDVDRGADGKHRVLGAKNFLHTEDVGQLGDGLSGALAQIDQRHIDDVGRLDVALDALTGVLAQTACLLGEFVELVSSRAGVHVLEGVVHRHHLLTGHAGVLDGVGDLLLHLGEGVHRLAASHHKAGEQGGDAHQRGLPLVELVVEAVPERLLVAQFGVDLGELGLDRLDLRHMGVPCGRAALHVVELAVQGLQGLVEFLRRRLVETAHHALDLHGRGLYLSDLALGVGEFPAELAEFYLVAAGSGFGDCVLQFQCPLFELLEHLLGLLSVDGQVDGCVCVDVAHSIVIF